MEIKLSHFETSTELAEIKVMYKSKQKNKIQIKNSKEVFDILFPLFDRDTIEYQEQFFLLLLNHSNRILGWIKLSMGGTAGTVVDPKIVFTLALKTNASGIILAHNHPSGNLSPSQNDQALTRKISEAGKFLDIKLLDHLIISPKRIFTALLMKG
jgi:DNA repair protein RadC